MWFRCSKLNEENGVDLEYLVDYPPDVFSLKFGVKFGQILGWFFSKNRVSILVKI